MIHELLASFGALGKAWREEATRRRKLTPNDAGADTLDYCAAEMARHVELQRAGTHRLTVEQYAALKGVSEQTVRNWIRRGELEAEPGARGGYAVSPLAERKRRAS